MRFGFYLLQNLRDCLIDGLRMQFANISKYSELCVQFRFRELSRTLQYVARRFRTMELCKPLGVQLDDHDYSSKCSDTVWNALFGLLTWQS